MASAGNPRRGRASRISTKANISTAVSWALVLTFALCNSGTRMIDLAEASEGGDARPPASVPNSVPTIGTTSGVQKGARMLQRSRSEGALTMLERASSGSAINGEPPRAPVPGERTITFSELFQKLSRPEMLEGVRPAQHTDPAHEGTGKKGATIPREKLVVVLVGLPARGKSYISHRLVNYLNWYGVRCRLFNVGAFRRQQMKAETASQEAQAQADDPGAEKEAEGAQDKGSRADFFSSENKAAAEKREELAAAVFEQLLQWLVHGGGHLAIFDATNTTKERRRRVLERAAREAGVKVMFVESICTDGKVVEANLAEKVRLSPDFKGMDFAHAVRDLKVRIANYESVYQALGEDELDCQGNSISFIKVINLSSKVIANNVHGRVARSVLTFLMNLHIVQRPIFLVRAPDPDGLLEEDSNRLPFPASGGHLGLSTGMGFAGGRIGSSHDLNSQDSHHGAVMGGGHGWRSEASLTASSGDLSSHAHTAEAAKVPLLQFEDDRCAVLEIAGEVNVVVHRKGNVKVATQLHYHTIDGSARAGVHYEESSGTLFFAELQTRQQIKVRFMTKNGGSEDPSQSRADINFAVVLSEPQGGDAVLGRKVQCAVSMVQDSTALPQRLRVDWAKLRFPDSLRLGRGMQEGGKRVANRLAGLLYEQVNEFYMKQHQDMMKKLKMMSDLAGAKLAEARRDHQETVERKGVIEKAALLQERMQDGGVPQTAGSNITSAFRLTGHLYNHNLLEKALDTISQFGGAVRPVGEPVLGGTNLKLSKISLRVQGIPNKGKMEEMIADITKIFNEQPRKEGEEPHKVEILEQAHDVGPIARIRAEIEEKQAKMVALETEYAKGLEAVEEALAMTEDQVQERGQEESPPMIFTSTIPLASETGASLFPEHGYHEETTSLNMADLGACHGLSLADVYESMGPDMVRQFQTSPYTARVPGGECLRDVVNRLEPFVVDQLERQLSPVVVVSHLSTLQVLYQYFVGPSSNEPFWKLQIPRGSVIQLVPHLFGFEERRFSFRPDAIRRAESEDSAVHMANHWE